jgi:hypothetical protein
LAVQITDQQTLDGIAGLIKMTADKAVMGCVPEKK